MLVFNLNNVWKVDISYIINIVAHFAFNLYYLIGCCLDIIKKDYLKYIDVELKSFRAFWHAKLNEIIYVNDNKFLEDNLDYIQTEKFILGIEKQSNNLDENQIKLLIEQRSKAEEDLTKIEKLLSNVSFLDKAPKEVIVKNENLKKQFLTKIKEINEIISN